MSINLTATFPPQPNTERGMRTPVSYDPKNKLIAYASGKLVVVRSVVDPEEAALVYTEHLYPVTAVAFSPSGYYIASGDKSGQVRVWNTSGEERITKGPYQATSAQLNGIDWCPDSQRVLAVGHGKERYGHGFTFDSGNTVADICGHSREINAVAVKPNRPMRAVTVGEDGKVVFYEGPPFRFMRNVSPHSGPVMDVAYSPDGAYFVTCDRDRKIALYDGKTGDNLKLLDSKHEGMIVSVSFASPTSIVSASLDCSVRLTDVTKNELVKVWQLPQTVENQQTCTLAATGAHPSGKSDDLLVLSVGLNGDIYYWDLDHSEPIRVVQGHQKAISALSLDDNTSANIVTGSVDGTVLQWSAKDGSGQRLDKSQHDGPVCAIVGNGDGKVWSAGWDSKIYKLNDESHVLTTSAQPVDVSKTEKYTLSISDSALELVKDPANGTESKIVPLKDQGSAVHAVGSKCIIGVGNRAELYELPELKLIHSFEARQADVSCVRISPDEKLVAIGDASGKIILHSLDDGYKVVTSRWTFHSSRVTSIRWSEDNQRVVTGASDTNIFIYNVERPARNIKVLGAHKDGVTQVVWAGSDKLISTGADAAVKKWDVESK